MSLSKMGKYVLLLADPIGQGTFSTVWLAYDRDVRRKVAIKHLNASSPNREDFLNEAKIAAQVGIHPNVVSVYSTDRINNRDALIR